MFPPQRIVCLTEETVETLYLLGEEERIVGISGYVVRPPRARREKPRVSAFTSADIPKILALKPDLVLTFSDLQADIAAEFDQVRRRGPRLQPAHRCRNLRHDPHRRRAGERIRPCRASGERPF
jgi:ABC-type hemin transport system substrate-binding protein